MRIAIDIDSTLHDYWPIFQRVAKRRFGVDMTYEAQRDWQIRLLRPEQVRAVIDETHSEENVLGAVPYEGAVEAISRWAADGHWIHITSHRADRAHDATARWLESIGLPHDDLHCSFDKITRCVDLGIELLIDDSPVNIVRALEVGITPATLRHPWNDDICDEERVISADDWAGLADLLDPFVGAGAPSGS